ncbi:AAA family ATPase [Pseudomonas sp. YH-1]|uniref:AAA family ATPase n=1 Tax=Pseudomonas sp. YH-1 TaxID=3384787 RepID=UPI003F7E1735
MSLLELKDKIKSHLVAGYPGLFIQSGEEARVDAMLQDISSDLGLHPKEWNLGYGWVDFFNKQPRSSETSNTDLATSLPSLLDDDLDGKLFVIKDARSALENQPLAVARLKQLLNRIQRHHRGTAAVALVSETLHIPPQIEAQITLLPMQLPRGDEIAQQLDAVCQELELSVPENFRQRLHAACSGLSQEDIRSALAMARQQHEQINDAALSLIQYEKEQVIAKSGVLEMLKVSESASDIGGLENLKQWLRRREQIFRRLSEAHESGVQAPKGVLIAGMPGCGKSLTAKAAAGLFQLPLLRLDIGSLLGKYVGESEHNMRRALSMAESVSPCILWIDELEKAFVGMNSGSGSEVSSRLFGYFLTWMQEKTGAVFVIATANNITALPPELLRKGRFDEVFYVGFPNAVERGAILDIHLKGEQSNLTAEARSKLVSQCRDYAGADIQNAVNEARETAFLEGRELRFEDLEAAIERTVPLRETLRDQVAKYEELFEKLKLKPASTCDGLSVAQLIQMAENPNPLRREEVAKSEDCPDDLLEKLAGDGDLKVRTAVYRNPNCPEKVLTLRINIVESEGGFDPELLQLACMHAHAPQDLLAAQFDRLKLEPLQKLQLARRSTHEALQQRLAADEDPVVRRALALGKSLSKELQQRLAKDPATTVRNFLASNDILHPDVQMTLARDESFEVRESLAELVGLSEAMQLVLARDENQDVREALANRDGEAMLPDSVQLKLVTDCLEVRRALARNSNLGAPAQLLLAQDPSVAVRCDLAEHPALASATIQCLMKDVEDVQEKLAGSRHLASPLLQITLSRHESRRVRTELAGNSALNTDVQAQLAKDSSPSVREALAGNEALTAAVAERLMHDTHEDVRKCLARGRRKIFPSVQLHLVNDSALDVRVCLASSADLPDEVQKILAGDLPEVRWALAENTSISVDVQQDLFDSGDLITRLSLAQNKALAGSIQAQVADDKVIDVRARLASIPDLTASVVNKLIHDVEDVQTALAHNPSLVEFEYERLFKAGTQQVREALAGNSAIGPALMAEIFRVESAQSIFGVAMGFWGTAISGSTQTQALRLKLALASNRKLPAELQATWVESSPSLEVLQALASNPALSKDLHERLATHHNAKVREMVAGNDSVGRDVLIKLLADPEAGVRAALLRDSRMDRELEIQLAQDQEVAVRRAVAALNRPSKAAQRLLAFDPDKTVRARLVQHSDLPGKSISLQVQEVLARDDEQPIRQLLATYPALEPSVQVLLTGDESISVRKTLAKFPWLGELCEEAQIRLAQDIDLTVRLAFVESKKMLPNAQAVLAEDSFQQVKLKLIAEAAPRSQLGLEAQQVLVTDPDNKVRVALVDALLSFPQFVGSEEALLELAGDPDEEVRDRFISRPMNPQLGDSCIAAVKARLLEVADHVLRAKLEEADRLRES